VAKRTPHERAVRPRRRLVVDLPSYVEKSAERHHGSDKVGSPVADERQGKALRGQAARHHAEVEHGLEEDDERHAVREQAPKAVRRLRGDRSENLVKTTCLFL